TNLLLERCVRECIEGGYMRAVDEFLFAYQIVMFCHAWALKNWALRDRYGLGDYVSRGIGLIVEPFLTAKGRAALAALRRRSDDFQRGPAPRPASTRSERAEPA
ncbi:MAG: hypothetical protein KJ011_13170, partial [Burkholderiaceae bacterium]|nr:hypothetical protein [Burkholderiaceae bacterium]